MNKNTEKIRRLHQRGGLKSFKELGVLLALVALCIVIGLINPVFFSPNNLLNVFLIQIHFFCSSLSNTQRVGHDAAARFGKRTGRG